MVRRRRSIDTVGSVDLVGLLVERAITEAMERGEFDTSRLHGTALPDLDEQRRPGWWAEQLVARERSRVLREDTDAELATTRARLWQSATLDQVRERVTEANRRIAGINARLQPADRIALVDYRDALDTWRRTRPPSQAC